MRLRHSVASIGNAALEIGAMVDGITNEAMDQMCQVNLTANFALTRAFLPHMRARKWGRVIFSSSITSIKAAAEEGMAMYSAMKGALNSYAQVAASELGHDGITVNSLNLGVYITEMWQHNILDMLDRTQGPGAGEALNRLMGSTTALGRLGRAEEVEGLAQLLASEAGSYFTGAPIVIDGGMSIMLKPKAVRT
jgi:NAD(P)-dependent dehydrogenase (short-subunit alcohol dehydrogenase family)